MKYAFIEENRVNYNIKLMVKVLDVSRSGYYEWRINRDKLTPLKRLLAWLDAQVRRIFEQHRGRYGAPRITEQLNQEGHAVNRKTVAKSLKKQKLRARAAKKFKATTNSNHNLPVAPNLLKQDFTATAPNQKWVGDITYLWTDEGWLYLAVVIDLYSRSVVGWAMDHHMKAGLVCDALTMALQRRGAPKGVIVHSDRGSQYCSTSYQKMIKNHSFKCSMSKRGDCYDNACAESFFHSLKVELTHGSRYETRAQLRREIFEYIETYYNTVRLHSSNNYTAPNDFELLKVA